MEKIERHDYIASRKQPEYDSVIERALYYIHSVGSLTIEDLIQLNKDNKETYDKNVHNIYNFYQQCLILGCLPADMIDRIKHNTPLPKKTGCHIYPERLALQTQVDKLRTEKRSITSNSLKDTNKRSQLAKDIDTLCRKRILLVLTNNDEPKPQKEGLAIIPAYNDYYVLEKDAIAYVELLFKEIKPLMEAFTRLYGKGENEDKNTEAIPTPATQQDTATGTPLDPPAAAQEEAAAIEQISAVSMS